MTTAPAAGRPASVMLDTLARELINRYQGGFPLDQRPFRTVAADLETDEETLIDRLRDLLDSGILSRFGPLYDAECLGGRFTLAECVNENETPGCRI